MRVKVSLIASVCFVALVAQAQISLSGAGDSAIVAPSAPGRIDTTHTLDNIGAITGIATSIDGFPLSDCKVELRDSDHGTTMATAITGPSGHFEFRNVAIGRYEVVATLGLEQAHENVQVMRNTASLELRLNSQQVNKSATPTVSISEMRVPEKARQEWEKGEHALFKNKLQEARKHADRALAIAPQFAQALTLSGILKLGAGDTQGGVADLQQAIKNDPNYAMGYTALGAGLNAQRQFDEAERTLQRGMSLDPNAWQGWFELTKAQLARGEFKDALKSSTRAQELKKDYPSIHLLIAHALLGNHEYSRAVEEFELYLSEEPDSPNATKARAALGQARAYMQSAAR